MTKIRGIDFGPVWGASGIQGFFGEGYWFHKLVPGLNFKGMTFVAKTTTLHARQGNMPLKSSLRPQSLFPSCVVVKPLEGVTLNAVGLTGPGADVLFDDGRWQSRTEPFLLSFMSVAKTSRERFDEAVDFGTELARRQPEFKTPFGLQVNVSCPNTGHATEELIEDVKGILLALKNTRAGLNIPLIVKVNALFDVKALSAIEAHCDGICVSNTIPWGAAPHRIDWGGLFGESPVLDWAAGGPVSPLAKLGGGGLGGRPLLQLVAEWVKAARAAGWAKHINAGGGILRPSDVDVLAAAGADSVFLGSIAMLRGWRVAKTIKRAHAVAV